MSGRPMEVDVWKSDWGLPSVDLHCLEMMAYAKFSGAPLKANCTNNPLWAPSGRLPVFRHDKTVITSFQEMTSYLESKKFSADHSLTAKQKSECSAYSQLLQEKLLPAILFTWYLDPKNFSELTRPWQAKALPFPLNYYYPGRYERDAKKFIETLFVDEEDLSVIETHLFGEAEKCLTSMSIRLGENHFMFGSSPSSLDATLYAYLAPLLRAPFPNAVLQNYIKGCTNLSQYVARISQRYFPDVAQDFQTKQKEEKAKQVAMPSNRWRQFMAVFFALTAMSGYAMYNGILQTGTDESQMEERIDDGFYGYHDADEEDD